MLIPNLIFGQLLQNYSERTVVVSDRTLYISGENIFFSVSIISSDYPELALSKVMYVEIVTPFGDQVIGAKFKVSNNKCSGVLTIPKNTTSGYYYIRAYTKYMRKFGPKAYDYSTIKIFNPERTPTFQNAEEILKESKLEVLSDSDINMLIDINKSVFLTREQAVLKITNPMIDSLADITVMVTPENAYDPHTVIFSNQFGEFNEVRIENYESIKPLMSAVLYKIPADTDLSKIGINLFLSEKSLDSDPISNKPDKLSVNYPQNNLDEINYYTNYGESDSTYYFNFNISEDYIKKILQKSRSEFKSKYLPETEGITLGGIINQGTSSSDFSKDIINLTILSEKKNIFYPFQKDTSNYFSYDFADIYGNHDIFISVGNSDKENRILIENDFCTKPVVLPNPAFHLTNEEKNLIYSFIINNRVSDYFDQPNLPSDHSNLDSDTIPFYGKPDIMIYFKDYIGLPKLEDYFSELLSFDVRFKNLQGGKRIKILGDRPEMEIYDPLVMIDYVPIEKIEDILKLKPSNIYRIDIEKDPYLKGNVIYGGILNVLSVKNDFAGIKLPESGVFLNYKFLSNSTNHAISDKFPIQIPDSRNILYWNPRVTFNEKNEKQISFYTSDMKGIYEVHVIGIDYQGRYKCATKKFKVQ
ncbi:MAG: hypothetical protein C0597_07105 [Marinilabiliales bacterium]|nr:MAG: hypothetical protein C0597_07105 [Marinilabiliales bacterium]